MLVGGFIAVLQEAGIQSGSFSIGISALLKLYITASVKPLLKGFIEVTGKKRTDF